MNKLVYTALALSLLFSVSCNLNQDERDGRKYYTSTNPVQGRTGVSFKRVKTTNPAPVTTENPAGEPAGLLDRNEKPDEPGAEYWMHGQQSANPMEGKMGVRVRRMKKN